MTTATLKVEVKVTTKPVVTLLPSTILIHTFSRDRKRESQRERELKELAKLRETPEERRARRLAKKEAKEKRKREKMGLPESYAVSVQLFRLNVLPALPLSPRAAR